MAKKPHQTKLSETFSEILSELHEIRLQLEALNQKAIILPVITPQPVQPAPSPLNPYPVWCGPNTAPYHMIYTSPPSSYVQYGSNSSGPTVSSGEVRVSYNGSLQ